MAVTPAGAISFRYNYLIHGRQETITFGRYGVGGITLAEARERLGEAKKMIAAGKSPAKEKARDKARVKDAETFGAWAEKWLRGYQMADSTRDMRRSIYERELKPKFSNQKLVEITHEDLRALTDAIVERGAPATAVHAREVMLQVFRWAIERGQKVENPAELVRPTTIAKFEPRDRALTPDEIRLMYQYMERIGTTPSIRAAAKLLLLTMVRKSELTNATWSEINFSEALWTIPKERMKRRNPHLVFLSRQALDIFIALKTFAGGSDYVLPSRYDSDLPMSSATLNQVLTLTYRLAQKEGSRSPSSGHMTCGAQPARCCMRPATTRTGLRSAWRTSSEASGRLQQGRVPRAADGDVARLGGHDRRMDTEAAEGVSQKMTVCSPARTSRHGPGFH